MALTTDELRLAGDSGSYLAGYPIFLLYSPYKHETIISTEDPPFADPVDTIQMESFELLTNKRNISVQYGALHPVISLDKDILLTGSGTQTDPYVVVGLSEETN